MQTIECSLRKELPMEEASEPKLPGFAYVSSEPLYTDGVEHTQMHTHTMLYIYISTRMYLCLTYRFSSFIHRTSRVMALGMMSADVSLECKDLAVMITVLNILVAYNFFHKRIFYLRINLMSVKGMSCLYAPMMSVQMRHMINVNPLLSCLHSRWDMSI